MFVAPVIVNSMLNVTLTTNTFINKRYSKCVSTNPTDSYFLVPTLQHFIAILKK